MNKMASVLSIILFASSAFAAETTKPCYEVDSKTQIFKVADAKSDQKLFADIFKSVKQFSAIMELDLDSARLIAAPSEATNGKALVSVTGIEPDGEVGDHWYNYYKFVAAVNPTTCKMSGKLMNLGSVEK